MEIKKIGVRINSLYSPFAKQAGKQTKESSGLILFCITNAFLVASELKPLLLFNFHFVIYFLIASVLKNDGAAATALWFIILIQS